VSNSVFHTMHHFGMALLLVFLSALASCRANPAMMHTHLQPGQFSSDELAGTGQHGNWNAHAEVEHLSPDTVPLGFHDNGNSTQSSSAQDIVTQVRMTEELVDTAIHSWEVDTVPLWGRGVEGEVPTSEFEEMAMARSAGWVAATVGPLATAAAGAGAVGQQEEPQQIATPLLQTGGAAAMLEDIRAASSAGLSTAVAGPLATASSGSGPGGEQEAPQQLASPPLQTGGAAAMLEEIRTASSAGLSTAVAGALATEASGGGAGGEQEAPRQLPTSPLQTGGAVAMLEDIRAASSAGLSTAGDGASGEQEAPRDVASSLPQTGSAAATVIAGAGGAVAAAAAAAAAASASSVALPWALPTMDSFKEEAGKQIINWPAIAKGGEENCGSPVFTWTRKPEFASDVLVSFNNGNVHVGVGLGFTNSPETRRLGSVTLSWPHTDYTTHQCGRGSKPECLNLFQATIELACGAGPWKQVKKAFADEFNGKTCKTADGKDGFEFWFKDSKPAAKMSCVAKPVNW